MLLKDVERQKQKGLFGSYNKKNIKKIEDLWQSTMETLTFWH